MKKLTVLALALMVAACGGDDDNPCETGEQRFEGGQEFCVFAPNTITETGFCTVDYDTEGCKTCPEYAPNPNTFGDTIVCSKEAELGEAAVEALAGLYGDQKAPDPDGGDTGDDTGDDTGGDTDTTGDDTTGDTDTTGDDGPVECASDAECEDDNVCNGVSYCEPETNQCTLTMPEESQVSEGCEPADCGDAPCTVTAPWETDFNEGLSGPVPQTQLGDCFLTPWLDSSKYDGPQVDAQAQFKWLTVQFEHTGPSAGQVSAYVWEGEAADTKIEVAPTGGEKQLVTVDLTGSPLHYGSQLTRLGLCWLGPADAGNWIVGKARFGHGVPPRFGGPGPGGVVGGKYDAPPSNTSLTPGESKSILLVATEDDLQKNPTLKFLEFSVLDAPSWVTIKQEIADWDFAGAVFTNSLEIAPPADQEKGDVTVRVVVSDGFFEQWHTLTITVL